MTDITITHGQHHSKVESNTPAGAAFVKSRAGDDAATSYHVDPSATEYHGGKARDAGLTVENVQRS